ncbi:MAG: hypothetical protein IJJ85_02140 [Clostridia bacterium]|nr:hypothetical protein [Clostridia bacterium]
MKKKLTALLLSVVICLTAFVFPASAGDALPQSAHPYANQTDETVTYICPGAPDGIFVTFSADTAFASGERRYSLPADADAETQAFFAENGWYESDGVYLAIYDKDGLLSGWYTGRELAGTTLWLPGDRFSVRLKTDETLTGYGYRVASVSSSLPADKAMVAYHIGEEQYFDIFPAGEQIALNPSQRFRQVDGAVITGWRTAEGETYYYDADSSRWYSRYYPETTGTVAEAGCRYDLYAVTCPIAMGKDEVFSFLNEDEVFNQSFEGYVYTRRHFVHSIADWYGTFGLSPFLPIAAAASAFLSLYWPTSEFRGSCCGFSIAALLQHYGKIDLLSGQGVDRVSELEPDDEIQSIINFYNNQAIPCHLVNHLGVDPGTAEYSKQLKGLYEALHSGKPVYFEYYPGTEHPFKVLLTEGNSLDSLTAIHGILMTGAYTDDRGRHVLIAWDNNSSEYSEGYCDLYYIDPDFTNIYEAGWDEPLDGFAWNDDLSQFDSFKAEGISNPFAWHIAFFKNLRSLLTQVTQLLRKMRPIVKQK